MEVSFNYLKCALSFCSLQLSAEFLKEEYLSLVTLTLTLSSQNSVIK